MMKIYTDGSAHPNPGPGGFSFVVLDSKGEVVHTYAKRKEYTTNNEMELSAILAASAYAILQGEKPQIYSDSAYAINCLTNWCHSWKRNGWLKSDNKVPENLELIKNFYELSQKYEIELIKVKGHSDNVYNALADKLATSV